MKLTILGTSAAMPTTQRNLSAAALGFDQCKPWYLFDCGEGTQHQVIRSSLSLCHLKRIFITHLHGDHCYGLPGLLATRGLQGFRGGVSLYAPKGIKRMLETIIKVTQQNLHFPLDIHEITEPGRLYASDREKVEAIALSHDLPCFAYKVTESDRPGSFLVEEARKLGVPEGPLFGRLKRGETITLKDGREISAEGLTTAPIKGRKIIIGGDNRQPSLLLPHLHGVDLLVHEATYIRATRDGLGFSAAHSTAHDVAEVAQQCGLPHLILTHFSPRYGACTRASHTMNLEEIRREASAIYTGDLHLAEELTSYHLNAKHRLDVKRPRARAHR